MYDGTGPSALPAVVATVAATAASRTRPSRPMPRSTRTTDAASVRERAGFAVSAIRTTSPPMLLGRKLLKKVATRNDSVSARTRMCTPCASSSSPQRQALASTIRKYSASAAASQGSDADRA